MPTTAQAHTTHTQGPAHGGQPPSITKELWLPTTTTSVRVEHHDVTIWDDIQFEKRKIKTPIHPD